ncbi:hypothetical protein EJB05_19778, partial [Eragrostis curvula]
MDGALLNRASPPADSEAARLFLLLPLPAHTPPLVPLEERRGEGRVRCPPDLLRPDRAARSFPVSDDVHPAADLAGGPSSASIRGVWFGGELMGMRRRGNAASSP